MHGVRQIGICHYLGRRRIGKTYLVDRFFEGKFDFKFVGGHNLRTREQLRSFSKKAPDILKNMQGVVSQLDARKFASVLREELRKAADEMAHRFTSKIEPIVKRAESADRRISVPTLAAYITLAILVWLLIFLIMMIYANFKINSGDLTALIMLFFVTLIISIIAVIYFTKKYKW